MSTRPSDAMWYFSEASDSPNSFSCSQLFINFPLSLTERERRSEQFVFLCSSLEIEGQSKAPFFFSCRLGLYFICLISALYCAFSLSVCVCGRGVREQEQLSHPGRKGMGGSKLVFAVLSQWMRAPCGSAQL